VSKLELRRLGVNRVGQLDLTVFTDELDAQYVKDIFSKLLAAVGR